MWEAFSIVLQTFLLSEHLPEACFLPALLSLHFCMEGIQSYLVYRFSIELMLPWNHGTLDVGAGIIGG